MIKFSNNISRDEHKEITTEKIANKRKKSGTIMKYLGQVEHISKAVLVKNDCGRIPINGSHVYNRMHKCFGMVIDSLGNDTQSFQLVEITDQSVSLEYSEEVFVNSHCIFVSSLKDINKEKRELNR